MALKDITLGQYFPGNTLLHRLDPRTKLIAVVLYIVALFLAKSFVTITPDSPRALTAQELADYLKSLGAQAQPCETTAQGLEQALALAGPEDVVCACGSLYMIGEVRHLLGLC